MTIRALLFDLDGTLVRTNDTHVDAWLETFNAFGYRVGRARILPEIGKGGDLLVPSVLGADVEAEHGEAMRKARQDIFRKLVESRGVQLFEGVHRLLDEVRGRELRTALATSASPQDLQLVERLGGCSFRSMLDVVTTADDAAVSKPAPHILEAACEKLGEDPLACAMIGDSVHDASAARAAGVAFIGVTTGYASEADFAAAGARFIVRDLLDLRSSLDRALSAASPSCVQVNASTLGAMMDAALAAARTALSRREVPIGAAIFDRDGRLVVSGHYHVGESRDVTAHAEMAAFRELAHKGAPLDNGATLVSTLEPCVMCLGAAMEIGIDAVVYGLGGPGGGTDRIVMPRSPGERLPRTRGGVSAGEARALLSAWLEQVHTAAQRTYVTRLLAETI